MKRYFQSVPALLFSHGLLLAIFFGLRSGLGIAASIGMVAGFQAFVTYGAYARILALPETDRQGKFVAAMVLMMAIAVKVGVLAVGFRISFQGGAETGRALAAGLLWVYFHAVGWFLARAEA